MRAQVHENWKRMFVPESAPTAKNDEEPIRTAVLYHAVQVDKCRSRPC